MNDPTSPSRRPNDETIREDAPDDDAPIGVPPYIRASLTIVRGKEPGKVYALTAARSIIGRSEEATIAIDDQMMSREHAVITFHERGREFRVEDKQSANGTLLNGSKVTAYALRHGDKLLIGDTLFLFERVTEPGAGKV